MSPFGESSKIKAVIGNFADSDRGLDSYWDERVSGAAQADGVGYRPGDRSTFIPRLLNRWPFTAGRALRAVEGYLVNGQVQDTVTRYYTITKFNYDDGSETATLEGKDRMDELSKTRWLIPAPSNGKLGQDLAADVLGTFSLDPESNEAEYPVSGIINIGNELLEYSRAAAVFTILSRAAFGSRGKSHAANDVVQLAVRLQGRPDQVVSRMMVELGPLPAAALPLATLWDDEASIWLAGVEYDTIIASPTPGAELLAEIALLGISVWWKLTDQTVGFKTNRPIYGDTLWSITDRDLKNIQRLTMEEERLTEVYFQNVQIDPTDGVKEENFRRAEYIIDARAKNPNAYGDTKIKRHGIRWFNQGRSDVVRINAVRYLRRFSESPSTVRVWVDGGKYRNVGLTDFVLLTTDGVVDDTGLPVSLFYEVVKRIEEEQGHTVQLVMRLFTQVVNLAYVAPDDAPDYADATAVQKDAMAFIGPDTGSIMPDGRLLYATI